MLILFKYANLIIQEFLTFNIIFDGNKRVIVKLSGSLRFIIYCVCFYFLVLISAGHSTNAQTENFGTEVDNSSGGVNDGYKPTDSSNTVQFASRMQVICHYVHFLNSTFVF